MIMTDLEMNVDEKIRFSYLIICWQECSVLNMKLTAT